MSEARSVRFTLFGSFRAFRDGEEIALPDKSAGTYLRLLLLSGEPFVNNADGRRLGTSDSIRAIVDKANLPPKFGQWGRYDFKKLTGLEFRFRQRLGICLEGEGWSSDIHDFEEIWQRRSSASLEELQLALNLSQPGISIEQWPKEPVLSDCLEWARLRVAELREYRAQIEDELRNRREEAAAQLRELKQDEEASHAETSGREDPTNRFNTPQESSTPMREPVREQHGSSAEPVTPSERATSSFDGQSGVDGTRLFQWIRENKPTGADLEKLRKIRAHYPMDRTGIEATLWFAPGYIRLMLDADQSRANNLFVEGLGERLARYFQKIKDPGGRDGLNPYGNIETQAFSDGDDQKAWQETIIRERKRHDHLRTGNGGASFEEKRLLRACFMRSYYLIAKRFQRLVSELYDPKKAGQPYRTGISTIAGADEEIEGMFDYILALTHFQRFLIVEFNTQERQSGDRDPETLPFRRGETELMRRMRAKKMPWQKNILLDVIAVPDWSQPVARDLRHVHDEWLRLRHEHWAGRLKG